MWQARRLCLFYLKRFNYSVRKCSDYKKYGGMNCGEEIKTYYS